MDADGYTLILSFLVRFGVEFVARELISLFEDEGVFDEGVFDDTCTTHFDKNVTFITISSIRKHHMLPNRQICRPASVPSLCPTSSMSL